MTAVDTLVTPASEEVVVEQLLLSHLSGELGVEVADPRFIQ